jgi:hypothetical protein
MEKTSQLCEIFSSPSNRVTISALETLGKPKSSTTESSHGSLLGTKLIKLVPYKLQEKWVEVATNGSTDIDKVFKFIREQTEATERRLNRLKSGEKSKPSNQSNSQQPKESSQIFSNCIATSNRSQISSDSYKTYTNKNTNLTFNKTGVRECNRPCIFCNKAHWPTRCGKNLKERRTITVELKR